jgi:hypothetical protein
MFSTPGRDIQTASVNLYTGFGVVGWANDPSNFELITSRLRQAVDNPERVDEWIAQGEYLRSEAGSHYLDVIYRDGGVITPKVEENWWKITAAI